MLDRRFPVYNFDPVSNFDSGLGVWFHRRSPIPDPSTQSAVYEGVLSSPP